MAIRENVSYFLLIMWDLSNIQWLERISKDLGMLFLYRRRPYAAALVGHAAIQIMYHRPGACG